MITFWFDMVPLRVMGDSYLGGSCFSAAHSPVTPNAHDAGRSAFGTLTNAGALLLVVTAGCGLFGSVRSRDGLRRGFLLTALAM